MAENLANDFVTTLAGAVDNSTGTLTVVLASGAPAANFRIRVDDELMLVTAVAGTTWTATRGIEGTAAASHASGAGVVHVLTAGALAALFADHAPAAADITDSTTVGRAVITAANAGAARAAMGAAPLASPTLTGDLTLGSAGARIRGDFSNATVANRVAFQSSTVNGDTRLMTVPNGTATVSGLFAFNSSDPSNAHWAAVACTATSAVIASSYAGSPGAALPLSIDVGGVSRAKFLPTGEVGIGVTPAVGQGVLQVPNINGGQLAGNRRLNRNGNFDIWQRGNGPFTATGYTADGWVLGVGAGCTVAVSKVTFALGDYYGNTRPQAVIRFNQTVAGTAYSSLAYRMSNVRVVDNRVVSVSFWAVASTGSVAASIQTSEYFGSGGSAQIYQTAQTVMVTTTRQKFTYQFTIPPLFGNTVGAGDYFWVGLVFPLTVHDVYISEFQIELGPVATPFELWDSAAELAACRRWLRVQAVRVNTSATPTCMTIDMAAVPNISGGGTGYTSTGTTADTLICYQTTAAVQTITMSCEP